MTQDDAVFIHRQAWDLIPWLVNGSASEEQRRSVEQHLADCVDCREEHAFQLSLWQAMSQETPAEAQLLARADATASLRRLWRRIDAEVDAAPVAHRRRRASGWLLRGLVAAVLVEGVAIAALGAAQWTGTPAAAGAYRVLSAPSHATPRATIRAVLAPSLTLGELQGLLGRTQLQIVAGPSEAGVYSLAPLSAAAAPNTLTALAELRSQPSVRFAEPLDAVQPGP
jgi:hypothetical protein